MINLTLEQFSLYAVILSCAVIFLGGTIRRLRHRQLRRSRRRKFIRCRICGLAYTDYSAARDPECPHCGRLNDRGRTRRLG
ncbi:hypothetical protein [Persicirhabdus sediminis]|uniref:Hydrogenase nickel incorporation protein HypA n=1 Tax=Persicirhabdus sediminis TaxID=454144 RepID=A0A8J7MHB8_9BACT|nr:hypothetical protein [Persicirhabdus sediminis]MBK1792833.1 hypothetical protein [Persicirhabdus sediminis]